MKQLRFIVFLLCLSFATSTWAAQWPSRPITWIVPFAAGGATDVLAREIAQKVSQQLNQSIVIENVGGAGGTVGAAKASKAAPDGYTFLVGHLGYIAAAPSLYSRLPYDSEKDFAAVARFPNTPLVLLVNAESSFKSARDLIEEAKARPGKLNFGNAGIGSTSHLVESLFASRAGVKFTSVPYKGIPPAISDLMGGFVDAVFDQTNTALGNVASGRLRAIVITSNVPMAQYPTAEPLNRSVELGFDPVTWYGLYAPKKTPPETIQKMHSAYAAAMTDSTWTKSLESRGLQLLDASQATPESLDQFTSSEIERWRKVITDANIPTIQ